MRRPQRHGLPFFLQFYPRNYSRGVIAKLIFGGKDKTGDGYTRRASAEHSIFSTWWLNGAKARVKTTV